MIISTAVITRVNHKKIEHEFALLKEKENREIEQKLDIISIPVLIVASILSILGIILALI